MIPTERSELIRLLAEVSEEYPELRLGQLVANLAFWARGDQASAVWNVEDQELVEAAKEHLRNASRREQPVT